jgi:hypothetical protein
VLLTAICVVAISLNLCYSGLWCCSFKRFKCTPCKVVCTRKSKRVTGGGGGGGGGGGDVELAVINSQPQDGQQTQQQQQQRQMQDDLQQLRDDFDIVYTQLRDLVVIRDEIQLCRREREQEQTKQRQRQKQQHAPELTAQQQQQHEADKVVVMSAE